MCLNSPLTPHELAATSGTPIFDNVTDEEKAEFRFLFTIMNSDNSHWHLVVVDMERKVFLHLNSLKRNAKYKANTRGVRRGRRRKGPSGGGGAKGVRRGRRTRGRAEKAAAEAAGLPWQDGRGLQCWLGRLAPAEEVGSIGFGKGRVVVVVDAHIHDGDRWL